MKHLLIPMLCALLITAGCANQMDSPKQSGLSQPINSQAPLQQQPETDAAAGEETAPEPAADTADLKTRYYQAKAEEEALSIDIERLESDYRMNNLPKDDFIAQKKQLSSQKQAFDDEADRLEKSLPPFRPEAGWVDESDVKAMVALMRGLEAEEDAAENALDILEDDYCLDNITREEFKKQYAALKEQEDLLDEQVDYLEDALELLGWDD